MTEIKNKCKNILQKIIMLKAQNKNGKLKI